MTADYLHHAVELRLHEASQKAAGLIVLCLTLPVAKNGRAQGSYAEFTRHTCTVRVHLSLPSAGHVRSGWGITEHDAVCPEHRIMDAWSALSLSVLRCSFWSLGPSGGMSWCFSSLLSSTELAPGCLEPPPCPSTGSQIAPQLVVACDLAGDARCPRPLEQWHSTAFKPRLDYGTTQSPVRPPDLAVFNPVCLEGGRL